MLERILAYLNDRTGTQLLRDALDILLVYYVFYRALLVVRGTRAMQVGLGLGVVFLFYLVAQWLQLVTVLSILGALISSIILVIVVVFQNDIRRGLMRVGSRAWLGGLSKTRESKVIDEVVEAATELARHRMGAIITFEQEANLDEFVGVHKGHVLDATVTRELLVSLFIPESMNKLHDGAVIIRNLRVAKAGVFFPMPEGRVLDPSFGSRHRAALGITEETDAVVVVVSEERGTISFCFNGNIASNLDGPKLRTMLEAIFSPKLRKKQKKKKGAAPVSRRPSLPSVLAEELVAPSDVPPPEDEHERESDAPPVSVRTSSAGQRNTTPSEETPRPEGESEPPPPLRARRVSEEVTMPRSTASPLLTPVSGRPVELLQPGPTPIVTEAESDADEEARDSGAEERDST